MIDDSELLRRYAHERSEEAFAELVQRRIDLVYGVALRQTGDSHLAEDAVQAVFTDLARKAASLSRRPVLAGWLYRSAQFAANNLVRRERRWRDRDEKAAAMIELSPEDRAAWDQLRPDLDRVLSALDEIDRDALVLRYFDGFSLAEVGQRLRLSENAARMRVDRALEKTRLLLARRGITSTTAALGTILTTASVSAAPASLALSIAGAAMSSASFTMSPVAIFQLMSTTKFIASVSVIAIAVCVALFRIESGAHHEAQLRRAMADQELAALTDEVDVARRQSVSVESSASELERAITEARAAREADQAQLAVQALGVRDPVLAGQEFLAAHPRAMNALMEVQRAGVRKDFQLFFEQLGLTEGQINDFVELRMQFQAGVTWNTSRQAPAAQFNASNVALDEIERRFRGVLGETGFHAYEEFLGAMFARGTVERLAGNLFAGGDPLTKVQADQLNGILVRNGFGGVQDGRPVRGNPDWEGAMKEVGSILSASQLASFVELRPKAPDPFQKAVNQAASEAMRDAKLKAGVPLNY